MNINEILIRLQSRGLSPEEAKKELIRLQTGNENPFESPGVKDDADEEQKIKKTDIAIIGISGRYPDADSLEQYWHNLREGRDSVDEIPLSRWDMQKYFDPRPSQNNKIYCNSIGLLNEAECFDPLFFHISPAEAELMDPQHRLFLQEGYRAFEDAGYSPGRLDGKKCGVYLGMMNNEYGEMVRQKGGIEPNITANSYAIAAARISYFLNIKGPAIAVDTACSSSLVSMHLACQALWNKEIDMALAGGVSLYLSPETYIGMCAAGMLSPDGRCKTFDNAANGFVPGEGAGAVVLKRLEDALADRDSIYGVIIGSGINQDGKTNGITAPSVNSQISLERDIYNTFNIHPDTISYVEMHGTGTKLGDPIELEALSTVYREWTQQKQYCSIGSVKSNIGHASAAAGVASVHKVLLSIKHKQLPASLNYTHSNEHFNFIDSPFYVQTELTSWERVDNSPRRAGISSFGFSGTNAHLVIEEYIPERNKTLNAPDAKGVNPYKIFVLSAKNNERLWIHVEQLLNDLKVYPDKSLIDIAYTLQTGREQMEYRLAIVAGSRESLIQALNNFLAKHPDPNVFIGQSGKNTKDPTANTGSTAATLAEELLRTECFDQLAERWVKGLDIEWHLYYEGLQPYRISLPGYPFAKIPCWIPEYKADSSHVVQGSDETAYLHPLVQRNTSNLHEHRYSSFLSGQESFFTDHLFKGVPLLPGAAYLEMARSAVCMSTEFNDSNILRLEQIVWLKPLSANDQSVEVHIRLIREEDASISFQIYSFKEEQQVVHCRGSASVEATKIVNVLDLDTLLHKGNWKVIEGEQFYKLASQWGFDYGPDYQRIQQLYVDKQEGLAKLIMPAPSSELDQYVLDPGMLDSALHAAFGLLAADHSALEGVKWILPVSLHKFDVIRPCKGDMWAWIRPSNGSDRDMTISSFDIDICDEQGMICLQIWGLCLKKGLDKNKGNFYKSDMPIKVSGSQILEMPEMVIEAVATDGLSPNNPSIKSEETDVGDILLTPIWEPVHWDKKNLYLDTDERVVMIGEVGDRLNTVQTFFHKAKVLHISPEASIQDISTKLENTGPITHLIWISSCEQSLPLDDESIIFKQKNGVLFGFRLIKALLHLGYGKKEIKLTVCTEQIQSIHLGNRTDPTHGGLFGLIGTVAQENPVWKIRIADLEAGADWPLSDISSLPFDMEASPWVYRNRVWHRQKLVPVLPCITNKPLYRQGGVYVVIGGAGGVGSAWSEYMIRTYQAQIVWIGRKQHDDSIQTVIDRIALLGSTPMYIAADATDLQAMKNALEQIQQNFSVINGVVHSAFVLSDQSLTNMDEQRFLDGYSAKLDTSVNMGQVFGTLQLDFILFFSSVNSFVNTPGQCNYTAGCTFQDGYARHLAQQLNFRVKVVNWGYWGNVGAVATEYYQKRMEQAGWGSIEPSFAMNVLESLLSNPIDQIVMMKTVKPLPLPGLQSNECLMIYPDEEEPNSCGIHLSSYLSNISSNKNSEKTGEILTLPSLLQTLSKIVSEISGIASSTVDPNFEWSEYALDHMQLADFAQQIHNEIGMEVGRDVFLEHSTLLMLANYLADESTGRGNQRDDSLNEQTTTLILAYVEERLNRGLETKIAVVGAGARDLTEHVWQKLQKFPVRIDVYLDEEGSLSKLENEIQEVPTLIYKPLNLNEYFPRPGIDAGIFDVAILSDSLQSHRDIRTILRFTKGLLRTNGLLMLRHYSGGHLSEIPKFSQNSWNELLYTERFGEIYYPFGLETQMMCAFSDGVIRQHLLNRSNAILEKGKDGQVRKAQLQNGEYLERNPVDPEPLTNDNSSSICLEDHHDNVETFLIERIVTLLSQTLKVDRALIEEDVSFAEYGVDSITGVHFIQHLNETLGIELETTDIFDYSSVQKLGDYISSQYKDTLIIQLNTQKRYENQNIPMDEGTDSSTEDSEGMDATSKEPIAIIGMSGRFARSNNMDEFWEHLANGTDLIEEVTRWDLSSCYPDTMHYCRHGSFLDKINEFDPLFFNISAVEATYMDPQQRIFLEESWKSLEDAGYAGENIQGRSCGVYVGCGDGDYEDLFDDDPPPQSFWGNASSIIPARIAYYLNLHGPAVAVNTACSSSLVAIHLACQALWTEEIEMALAGGVFVQSTPWFYMNSERAGMLSSQGRCHAFDERADGFVPGEGAGVVVLKRLRDALADGDNIYGIIRGSGLNQDGTTNGITAPSANSQENLVRSVYETFSIDPGKIQMVEAHGTGTPLGDPIEFTALSRVYRSYNDKIQYCAIGSVKTNIGHTATVAGVAGLLKILLSLKHRKIPKSLHFSQENARIALEESPFYVPTELRDWPAVTGSKRCAAVSSFGFSGTNAHLVVEEPPEIKIRTVSKAAYMIVLSARTQEQLEQQVKQLLWFCENNPNLDCGDVSGTLLLGRKHFSHRLAFIVKGPLELQSTLKVWLENGESEHIYQSTEQTMQAKDLTMMKRLGAKYISECGRTDHSAEYVQILEKVAEIFTQGCPLEFKELFIYDGFRIVSLPTYPFAAESYWVPEKNSEHKQSSTGIAELHPLLYRNTSDLNGFRFTTCFDDVRPVVEIVINKQKILSGTSFLEIALAAVEQMYGMSKVFQPLMVKNIIWAAPVFIAGKSKVTQIEVYPHNNNEINFEVFTESNLSKSDRLIHCQGIASLMTSNMISGKEEMKLDPESIGREASYNILSDEWYEAREKVGESGDLVNHAIEKIFVGAEVILVKLQLSSLLNRSMDEYLLHPVILNDVLQTTAIYGMSNAGYSSQWGVQIVPAAIKELHLIRKIPGEAWASIRPSDDGEGRTGNAVKIYNIDLYDNDGRICASIKDAAVVPLIQGQSLLSEPIRV